MQACNELKFLNARHFGACGSGFETVAEAVVGSDVFTLSDIGDFAAGNEVILFGCNTHIERGALFEKRDTSPVNPRPWTHNQPIDGRIELRGYDGPAGSRAVYIIDLPCDTPDIFRWSDSFGKIWHEAPRVISEWTKLQGNTEVKINLFKELEYGCTAVFVCSDRMIAVVQKVEGNKIRLSQKANKSGNCRIVHSDGRAIQRAIDEAVAQRKSVFLPNGRYRIARSLCIENAKNFTFEGESSTDTVIDNSLEHCGIEKAEGSCFILEGGEEITVKNLCIEGCLGFEERDTVRWLKECAGTSVWGFYFKKSNASCIHGTKRVLFKNCHARRMSAECFYAEGNSRKINDEPVQYNYKTTYLDCSVEDCARNAFNDNDFSEGTSIINCRIRDIGGCAWEGASRFVKITGCYMRNCGSIALGNVRGRRGAFDELGTGQHIITDNYFEGGIPYGPAMITVGSYASQVTVSNNVFVNFNSDAVRVMGETQAVDTPPENVIITANSFDMTAVEDASKPRCAVNISSDYVTVADNQIFVRGKADENLTGIRITDDVTRLVVHDNLLAGCGRGIVAEKVRCAVGEVISDTEFYRYDAGIADCGVKPTLLRNTSHGYRGWKIVWLNDGTESEIREFDPVTTVFRLTTARKMITGDEFYIYSPRALPWSIHHNIIDNCKAPVMLDTWSGNRAYVESNIM